MPMLPSLSLGYLDDDDDDCLIGKSSGSLPLADNEEEAVLFVGAAVALLVRAVLPVLRNESIEC